MLPVSGTATSDGSASGSDFSIAFVNGPISFNSEEGVLYARLFHIVDTDADGYIGGIEGAAFVRRARLVNDANREIWRLASGGKSQEKLNKDCWFVAMKLVALVQSTGKCQMQCLYLGETLPLANFQLEQPVDNVVKGGGHLR
uniref:EF-hand domain-containing protein n=1 Tax=Hyaloperonospora arabidopsidis (strain Emoy2) TaxID=559515 RepID=M4B2F9_HYAAE